MRLEQSIFKDKVFWILLIILFIFPILIKAYSFFVFIPAILLLILILLWPYIQLAIFVVRMIKNTIVNSYKLFRGKLIEIPEEIPLKEFLIKLHISFFRAIMDFVGLLLLLISLMACGFAFTIKPFKQDIFGVYIVFYFLGFFIIMFSRHFHEIIKRKKSTQIK